MIDANWTIDHTEQLAMFIYQRSYHIAPYKNVNHVDFENTIKFIAHFVPFLLFSNPIYLLLFHNAIYL